LGTRGEQSLMVCTPGVLYRIRADGGGGITSSTYSIKGEGCVRGRLCEGKGLMGKALECWKHSKLLKIIRTLLRT
jgi:hypothetical protein